MSGRARLPFSQGLGGSIVAQADRQGGEGEDRDARHGWALVPAGDQRRDAMLEAGLVLVEKAPLDERHLAAGIDEI